MKCGTEIYGFKEIEEHVEISHLKVPVEYLTYFGFVNHNLIISTCGVAPISNQKAEIIGVNTYNVEHRNKGFAKSVCTFAMNSMNKDFNLPVRNSSVLYRREMDSTCP